MFDILNKISRFIPSWVFLFTFLNVNIAQEQKNNEIQEIKKQVKEFDKWIHSDEFQIATEATNPTNQEISDYGDQLSAIFKIPAVVLKAVMYQESSWRQFDQNGDRKWAITVYAHLRDCL